MTAVVASLFLLFTPSQDAKPAEAKRVVMGKDVWLEMQGEKRRVIINTQVCFREGFLELFACKRFTKEHEAVLSADVDARDIHKALLLCGIEPGKPVQFAPKYEPAKGPVIKLFVEYELNGMKKRVPAQEWVREAKTKKDMKQDWVFTGSILLHNPLDKDKPPVYAANHGDLICLSNFQSAILDIPIRSTDGNDELLYEANTERIPPLQTPVTLILEPEMKAKK